MCNPLDKFWVVPEFLKSELNTKDLRAILDYLEHYEGNMVCSRQLYAEALANDGSPAHWEIREIKRNLMLE